MLHGSMDGRGVFGENGYMCTYSWVPLLFTWNYHNIVNRLYANTKFKKKIIKDSPSLSPRVWCVDHISSLTQGDGPRLMRAADGGSPPLESGYCRQLTAEAQQSKSCQVLCCASDSEPETPLSSSVWRCWSETPCSSENQHIKSGPALPVLPLLFNLVSSRATGKHEKAPGCLLEYGLH